MPGYQEGEAEREARKLERLGPAMEALARREPARQADPAYRMQAVMAA